MSTILSKDEKVIKEATFVVNLILNWLKANYTLTNKRITGYAPNTIFGVIPFGKVEVAQPLKTVASVSTSTKFYIMRLVAGGFFLIVGLVFFSDDNFFMGVLILVPSIIMIMNSYKAAFVITNNAGQSTGYELSIKEKSNVSEFVNEINMTIAEL